MGFEPTTSTLAKRRWHTPTQFERVASTFGGGAPASHLVRDEGVAGSIPPLRPAFLDIVPRLRDRLRGSNWKRALFQFRGTGRVTAIGEVAGLQMPRESHVGKLLP